MRKSQQYPASSGTYFENPPLQDLTWSHAAEQIVKLFDSVDSREAQAAFFLMVIYSPGITATSINVGIGPCYGGMCGSTSFGNEGDMGPIQVNMNNQNMFPQNNFNGVNGAGSHGSRQMFSLMNGDVNGRNRPWSRVSDMGNPWSRAASMQGDAFPPGGNMENGFQNVDTYGQQ
ncbi:hypothetical protein Y032_0264g620 [Ancylostoma ceylanicum]|uniref:Uncharacterized protein n=1 Tax=Ancylostoma ceylanicum TaxID=53326 RepID=A0A016SAD1_9BILA|nr:hypothetical protein Y032_0264g620 [Ancylostoma ceylanicum]